MGKENMNNDIINEWLLEYEIPLQELAIKHNVGLGEVREVAELYLLINSSIDVVYHYKHLERYGNKELQKEISDLICNTF